MLILLPSPRMYPCSGSSAQVACIWSSPRTGVPWYVSCCRLKSVTRAAVLKLLTRPSIHTSVSTLERSTKKVLNNVSILIRPVRKSSKVKKVICPLESWSECITRKHKHTHAHMEQQCPSSSVLGVNTILAWGLMEEMQSGMVWAG